VAITAEYWWNAFCPCKTPSRLCFLSPAASWNAWWCLLIRWRGYAKAADYSCISDPRICFSRPSRVVVFCIITRLCTLPIVRLVLNCLRESPSRQDSCDLMRIRMRHTMESKSPALQQALQTEEVTSSTLDICKMDIDGDKQLISIAGWSSFTTNS
jgi:hypothetical protein